MKDAETYLRGKYGAYRSHFAWRELEEAFNAGAKQLSYQYTDGNLSLEEEMLDAIGAYAQSEPAEDETWESWFEAAFDLARSRVKVVFAECKQRAMLSAAQAEPVQEAAKIIERYLEESGVCIWGDEDSNELLGYKPPDDKKHQSYINFMMAADWLYAHGFADWGASGQTEYVFIHKTPRTRQPSMPKCNWTDMPVAQPASPKQVKL